MKNKISQFISHPSVILGSWFIFVFFLVVILPAVVWNTQLNGITQTIDTNFSFNPALIYPIIESYGEGGREYYLWQRWTFDLVWPMVYGLPMFFTLNRFVSNTLHYRLLVVYSPLLAIILDYIENVMFTLVVSLYPSQFNWLVILGVSMSLIKWFFVSISLILTIFFIIVDCVKYIGKLLKKS